MGGQAIFSRICGAKSECFEEDLKTFPAVTVVTKSGVF